MVSLSTYICHQLCFLLCSPFATSTSILSLTISHFHNFENLTHSPFLISCPHCLIYCYFVHLRACFDPFITAIFISLSSSFLIITIYPYIMLGICVSSLQQKKSPCPVLLYNHLTPNMKPTSIVKGDFWSCRLDYMATSLVLVPKEKKNAPTL